LTWTHSPIDMDTQPYWHGHTALLTWTHSPIDMDTQPYWHGHTALYYTVIVQNDMDRHCGTLIRTNYSKQAVTITLTAVQTLRLHEWK